MIELPVVLFPQDGQSETSGQPAWGAASRVEVDLAAAALIEFEMAERHLALPLHAQGRILLVAMANPDDREAVAEISQRTGLRVRPVRAAPEDLLVAIGAAYTEVGRRSPPAVRLPLGQLLVQRRLITADQLEEALRLQQRTGSRLGRILVGLGAVNRLAVGEALAEQLRLPHVNLRLETPAVETVRLLEAEAARRLQCVPVRWVGSQLMVAMADPGRDEPKSL